MSRIKEARIVDPVLTNVALGYIPANLIFTKLFPIVSVPKEDITLVKFGKEAFKIYETLRAPGARRKRMEIAYSTEKVSLEEHSLERAVDDRLVEEATNPIKPFENATKTVQRAVLTKLEYLAAQEARNQNNYDSDNVVTLTGTDQWNDYSNSAPIDDIQAGIDEIESDIGIPPNTLVLGSEVYNKLKFHPEIVDKIKYVQKAIATPDLIAAIFDLKQVLVGRAVYAQDDGTFVKIWGKDAILAYVPTDDEADLEVPAYGYTPRKDKYPLVEKYRDESANSTVIYVTHIEKSFVTSIYAGYLIKNAVA